MIRAAKARAMQRGSFTAKICDHDACRPRYSRIGARDDAVMIFNRL
jgi:hypothetical protein